MANGLRRHLLGIESFAPEFWRLVAEPALDARHALPKAQHAPGARPHSPDSPPSPSPAPPLPPLTNDGLEALRRSLGGFGNNLQDIPPTPPPPAVLPPLTSEALRKRRDPESGSGDLRDIPSPPEHQLPHLPNVEVPPDIAANIKEIWKRHGVIERLEKEKRNPARSAADRAEFDKEIEINEKVLREQETILEEAPIRSARRT